MILVLQIKNILQQWLLIQVMMFPKSHQLALLQEKIIEFQQVIKEEEDQEYQ